MRKIGLLLVALGFVLSTEQLHAQNWRRDHVRAGSGRFHPSTPAGIRPRLDPSASSDTFRPGGSHIDPSASSDPFFPSVPWYPPVEPSYPPTQTWPPFDQPSYPPVSRKFLGVTSAPTSNGRGVYVTSVVPYSAAFRVGIEPGDVIYSIDGISVHSPQQLARTIRYSDGFVELYIRDVRTGQVVMRNADLTQ